MERNKSVYLFGSYLNSSKLYSEGFMRCTLHQTLLE